jgi:hypothetical protein
MGDNYDDPYESTAQWLQEAARRRGRGPGLPPPTLEPKPVSEARRGRTLLGVDRDIHMLAVAAALFLNYYFMQVTIEIDSMRSVLVFVRPLVG